MSKDTNIKDIQDIKKPSPLGYSIKQSRSQKTYDALITTGFKLLETRTLETITIAELAREAGYSVGAFYSRFVSKDEFFDALLQYHMALRLEANRKLFASSPPSRLIKSLVVDLVTYYWEHRHFWRAALVRNTRDPDFWAPIRKHGETTAQYFINYINERRANPLKKSEIADIRFAFQVSRGVINNAILNQPGPAFMGQSEFVDNLIRAFLLISNYNSLLKPESVS